MGAGATFESARTAKVTAVREPWWAKAAVRRTLLVTLALAPFLTPVISPTNDVVFVYPCCMVTMLLSAWFCWQTSRIYPEERLRWQIVMVAQCLHGMAYAVTSMELLHWASATRGAWVANAFMATCRVLFLPALMGIRATRGMWVRSLDYALAVVTAGLMMRAMGSGSYPGGSLSRIMVGFLAVSFIAAAAFLASVASARPGIRLFASVITMYLAVTLVVYILLDIVNLYWVPTPYVLASDVIVGIPQLLLCELAVGWQRAPKQRGPLLEPALVDSFQPSMMAIGGVFLALFGFRTHPVLAAIGVVVLVLCYAVRTQLFYYQLLLQQKQLRTRAGQMEELATRDALTKVGNRRWFDEEAEKLLTAARAYPCSMVLVDADTFKEINDRFGHPLGDEVLRAVAAALSEVTAQVKRGLCARIGGDEFGALWPGTSAEQAILLAELVRAKVETAEFDAPLRATVSVGVVTTQETLGLMKLMRWADSALYRSKAAGRNVTRAVDLGRLAEADMAAGE